jgi:uncharacterized membrane protein YbhN (UPF0104 family)
MKLTKLFQISISILFVYFILNSFDFSNANYYLNLIEPLKFVSLVILILIVLLFNFYKWQEISDKNKILKIINIKIYLKSRFFNVLGLGSAFGDIYKFLRLKKIFSIPEISGFIIIDRLIGITVMLYLLMIILLIQLKTNYAFIKNYIWLTPCVIIIILVFHSRSKILKIIHQYLNLKQITKIKSLTSIINRHYYLASMYGFISSLIWFFAFFVLLKFLESEISFFEVIFICTLTEIIRSIPISFNGIGVREFVFAYFLSKIGYSYELGIIVSSFIYIILTIECILCYPLSLFVKDEKN